MKKTPKQSGFFMPAEWQPHARCWMAWPCRPETWSKIGIERARLQYASVARAIARFEPVTMIVRPEDEKEAKRLCTSDIQLLPLNINDSWTRDTGPSFLVHSKSHLLAGVDWIHNAWGNNYEDFALDNQMAKAILDCTKAQHFKAPLVMEGGSFHVDGEGSVLTTRECLLHPNRNPHLSKEEIEVLLCEYLGAQQVIWLNKGLIGDETDGHIDEIACFIAPDKILCLISNDPQDPNYFFLQENRELLKKATNAKGQPYEIYTVEQAPATFLGGERLSLSYINFYRANKGIVMPAFGYKSYDQKAYALFKDLFLTDEITQIDALDIFAGGGGIHCITQQQPLSK